MPAAPSSTAPRRTTLHRIRACRSRGRWSEILWSGVAGALAAPGNPAGDREVFLKRDQREKQVADESVAGFRGREVSRCSASRPRDREPPLPQAAIPPTIPG